LAREALQLRDWAARALLLPAPPAPPPRVSAAAWQFFARMEWCATPLQQVLEEAGVATGLDAGAVAAQAAALRLETARIASAREQLAALSQLAQRLGLRVVVFKGGVAVAQGEALHLEDLDVAVEADAGRLVRELDPDGRHGPWSLGQYRIPPAHGGGVAVEVHASVRELGSVAGLVAAAQPLPGHPGLFRPSPREHLWHLLTHATATHPDRIARLRDLLLLRTALAECTEADVREVEQRAARRAGTPLGAVLAAARTGVSGPVLERFVRRRYFLLARWEGLGRRPALRLLLISASELTAPPRGDVIRKLFEVPDRASVFPGMPALFARVPRVDSALRLGFRPAVLLGALTLCAGAVIEERVNAARSAPATARAAG